MIRISARDYKDIVDSYLDKNYPPALRQEIRDEISGKTDWNIVTFTKEQAEYAMSGFNKLKYPEPRQVPMSLILNNPNNQSVFDRVDAYKNKGLTSDVNDPNKPFLREPQNIEKFKKMDPKTQPPISIKQNGEVQFGMHRTITSILRGDKTILAWVFE